MWVMFLPKYAITMLIGPTNIFWDSNLVHISTHKEIEEVQV